MEWLLSQINPRIQHPLKNAIPLEIHETTGGFVRVHQRISKSQQCVILQLVKLYFWDEVTSQQPNNLNKLDYLRVFSDIPFSHYRLMLKKY